FLVIPRPPSHTLFPYTTLFRSPVAIVAAVLGASLLVRPVTINSNNAALCGYVGYGYGVQPAVDTVTPNTGPTSGGTVVTLTGCGDRKSTRLNSSHLGISYAVFC